jgi:hypothetical protein
MVDAILSFGEKCLDVVLHFLKRKKPKTAADAFVDFAEIKTIVKHWVHGQPLHGFERVAMKRAHNGQVGKRLMPSGFKYISMLDGDQRKPFEDLRTVYQNIPQDNAYIRLMGELCAKQELFLETATMEEGLLKDLYTKEGVVRSRMFFLAANTEEVWFITIATSQHSEHFDTASHKSALFLGVARIRAIVKPYFK